MNIDVKTGRRTVFFSHEVNDAALRLIARRLNWNWKRFVTRRASTYFDTAFFFLTCRHDSEWNLFTYLAERKSHNIQHRKFSGEWFLIRRERRSSIQILEIVRICRGRRSWEGNSTIRNCFFLASSYLFSVDFSFCLLPSFVSPPLPSLCEIAMRKQCWGWKYIYSKKPRSFFQFIKMLNYSRFFKNFKLKNDWESCFDLTKFTCAPPSKPN